MNNDDVSYPIMCINKRGYYVKILQQQSTQYIRTSTLQQPNRLPDIIKNRTGPLTNVFCLEMQWCTLQISCHKLGRIYIIIRPGLKRRRRMSNIKEKVSEERDDTTDVDIDVVRKH